MQVINSPQKVNSGSGLDIRPELLPCLRKDVADAESELARLKNLFSTTEIIAKVDADIAEMEKDCDRLDVLIAKVRQMPRAEPYTRA